MNGTFITMRVTFEIITLISSDQYKNIWEKAVTGNGVKLCNGDFVISDRFLRRQNYANMRWAGHAACRRQITNACSILGRNS